LWRSFSCCRIWVGRKKGSVCSENPLAPWKSLMKSPSGGGGLGGGRGGGVVRCGKGPALMHHVNRGHQNGPVVERRGGRVGSILPTTFCNTTSIAGLRTCNVRPSLRCGGNSLGKAFNGCMDFACSPSVRGSKRQGGLSKCPLNIPGLKWNVHRSRLPGED
jgi:hypothetical protein